MKYVALVSGGKDSFYSIMECIRNGHELLACAHLSPRRQEQKDTFATVEEEEEESYMYQTAASEAIPTLVEECLGVPLVIRQCVGRSKNTSLVYDHGVKQETDGDGDGDYDGDGDNDIEDEVEDLYELLIQVKRQFPSVQAISSGAILSTYQRTRIESVCSRLNLTPLGYMWRSGTQRNLLECMLKDGIEAVLVKVASPPGLMPQKHLNKTLGQLFYGGIFDRLKERFDFHICGEGGEYETLVLDCPLFQKKKLCLDEVEIVETDDGVGILKVLKCSAIEKEVGTEWTVEGNLLHQRIRDCADEEGDGPISPTSEIDTIDECQESVTLSTTSKLRFVQLPHIKVLSGGLAHVSEIMSQRVPDVSDLRTNMVNFDADKADVEGELAVLEAQCIFRTLRRTLSKMSWTSTNDYKSPPYDDEDSATPKDVVFVHLYLSSISHFAKINKYYQDFFGIVLPPSRSCVAVGENVLRDGRRVMMDCMIQRGSGAYMRIQPEANLDNIEAILPKKNALFIKQEKLNPHHKLRSTLHVQTISHWAPVCVGPYSQANTLRSGLTFMAGQIGLVPGTMNLVDGGWKNELVQCWKNAASVLDALEGTLQDVLGAVVYINSSDVASNPKKVWQEVDRICREQMKMNGGVIAGQVDERFAKDDFGGYEDYETWKEMESKEENEFDKNDDGSDTKISFLAIALPQMPKGALSEVELICATSKASTCLDRDSSCSWLIQPNRDDPANSHNELPRQINWDVGNNGDSNLKPVSIIPVDDSSVKVESTISSLGKGCAAVVNTVAYFPENVDHQNTWLQPSTVIHDMLHSALQVLGLHSGIDISQTLHIRLFHTKVSRECGMDDYTLRMALHSVLIAEWSARNTKSKPHCFQNKVELSQVPASSVVPVDAIYLSPLPLPCTKNATPALGMQVIVSDLVHLETEMWIHHNRSY